MVNTIILKKGYAKLTDSEFNKFKKGDTIWKDNSNPEELNRWSIYEKDKAINELSRYKCKYERYNEHLTDVEEYALEYCECDEDGEFISGSDYDLADEF